MGQTCCTPGKDANQNDLRDRRKQSQSKKNKPKPVDPNTFKRELDEPEFVVRRRDSLGMAAKEYTEKIMGEPTSTNTNSFVRRTETTDQLQSAQGTMIEDKACYAAGTFAQKESLVPELEVVIPKKGRHSEVQSSKDIDTPVQIYGFETVSFGADNNHVLEGEAHDSAEFDKPFVKQDRISMCDIAEVRDKVPASPATQLVSQPKHFE